MNEVLAVLVLFKCKLEDSDTFQSLSASLNRANTKLDMLIYDNSPVAQYNEKAFCRGNINIFYISDVANPGVSKAYNAGAEQARKRGKKWIMLLDQDTSFPLDIIMKYRESLHKESIICAPLLQSGPYYISPCYYKWGRGKALKEYSLGINEFKRKSLLNSGMLIPLELFYKVGGYNENIQLDYSDHYFIGKVKKYTSHFYLLDVVCSHSLSAKEYNKNKALSRFGFYLEGAKEYYKEYPSVNGYCIVLLRTLKLTLNFKTLAFLKKYWNSFF